MNLREPSRIAATMRRRPGSGPLGSLPVGSPLVGRVLIGCGLVLLPWVLVLGYTLPDRTVVTHWSGVWVGLDAMEALGLICTGVLLARGSHRRPLPAAVTAALLVVDAWFDTMTAVSGAERAEALAEAVFAELPLALLCVLIAWRGLARPPRARIPHPCWKPPPDNSVRQLRPTTPFESLERITK
ncbi:hypothetical protein GXW82_36285 [Streptacidiphilus sp. 4-A2]|nr:hypothetical protein [Streptacidiphilus sp. 4-A2]